MSFEFNSDKISKINAHEFMGKNGFFWFFGVVENRKDPIGLGRCQIRIFGHHTEDIELMPTEDLPWAIPLTPLNNPESPKSPPEGTWVFGFFADGIIAQQPIMIASVPGHRRKNPFEEVK